MIPNIYHRFHEEKQCLVMRKKRGDLWLALPKVSDKPDPSDPDQTKLLAFGVVKEVF